MIFRVHGLAFRPQLIVLGLAVVALSIPTAERSAMAFQGGFHKSIPAGRSHVGGRHQPAQTFRQRNYGYGGGSGYGHSGSGHNSHRNRYGYDVGVQLVAPYGYYGGLSAPYGYDQPYGNYGLSYGVSSGAAAYSRYYSYTLPNQLGTGVYYGGPIVGVPLTVPFDSYQSQLSENNANRIQSLLDRQSAMKPTIPGDVNAIPPGFSIASETTVPTDAMSKSDQLLAEAAFRERRYPAALEAAYRALARDQDNGQLWLFAAQSHLALNKYLEAVQDLDLAIQLLDEDKWFWVVENFREFYRNEDYVAQMDRLSQHIATNPKDSSALGLRGYHFAGLGYLDEAILDLEKAAKLAPAEKFSARLLGRLKELKHPSEPILAPKPPEPERTQKIDPPLTLGPPDKS